MTEPRKPRAHKSLTQAVAWDRFRAAAKECPALARDIKELARAVRAAAGEVRGVQNNEPAIADALQDRVDYLESLAAHCDLSLDANGFSNALTAMRTAATIEGSTTATLTKPAKPTITVEADGKVIARGEPT